MTTANFRNELSSTTTKCFEDEKDQNTGRDVPNHIKNINRDNQRRAGKVDYIVNKLLNDIGDRQHRNDNKNAPPGHSIDIKETAIFRFIIRLLFISILIGPKQQTHQTQIDIGIDRDQQKCTDDLEQRLITNRPFQPASPCKRKR